LSHLYYVGGSLAGSETLYVDFYDATTNTCSAASALTATTTAPTTPRLATDVAIAKTEVTNQFNDGVSATNPPDAYHLTDNTALVDQLAMDIAQQFGTPSSHYVIGTSANTNGYTDGFINSSVGGVIGNAQLEDQCVALVQALDPGGTGSWRPGALVENGQLAEGTPIATFAGTLYGGSDPHAGFYLTSGVENGAAGFFVLDQFNLGDQNTGQPYPDHSPLNASIYEPAEVRFISVNDPNASSYHAILG